MDREKPTISIRVEEAKDFEAIKRLLEEAFLSSPHSDHKEAALVSKLRESPSYIKELSLVATKGEEVIGYLMMSKVKVGGETALALAPLAVLPSLQNQGVGTALVKSAHEKAAMLGYPLSLVLGDPHYYSRFGYKTSAEFGIKSPFDVPKENYMAISLAGQNRNFVGEVVYDEAFA